MASKFMKVAPNTGWQLDSSGIIDSSINNFGLVSAINLPTDTYIELTIDRVDSSGRKTPEKMERITGKIEGNRVIDCVRGVEGTAQAHSSGAVVEIVVSAAWLNRLIGNIDTIDPQLNGGWWNAGITATFSASANGVNKINVSQDLRNKLAVGNWFSLTQNNARRYYLISLVADNRIEGVGPDNLTNQPITDLKFSREYQPTGAWVRANVKAAMYRDGDQNLTSGQNNTFQLNKVQYDPMNICNTGAHTMIIPVTGFYLVSAGIRATSTDNISQLDLNVSGTVLNRRNCITNAKTTFDDVTVARECQLNKGTIIKCEGWYAGSGETKLQGGHPFSYLSVKFLSV